ncbi:MAG: hypothetical protein HQL88_06070 [Magnetococcales bacterium]|nr:hypothetical protein [Magnetococcales bacterium]
MVSGLFKWTSRHFFPYVAGILVGVGFFFLLMDFLPNLPAIPAFDWPVAGQKSVSLPVPPQPKPTPLPPGGSEATGAPPVQPAPLPVDRVASVPAAPPARAQTTPVETGAGPVPPGAVVSLPHTPAAPNTLATPDTLATEQPLEPEWERDPVEMAASGAKKSQPPAARPQLAQSQVAQPPAAQSIAGAGKLPECGTPPNRPGASMDQYLACQWRAECLDRLGRARRMIEQEQRGCPTVGVEAQACAAYYHALEQQYHPSLCNGWSNGRAPGRW